MRYPPPAPPLTPAQSPRGFPLNKRDAVTTLRPPSFTHKVRFTPQGIASRRRRITSPNPRRDIIAEGDFIFAEDFTGEADIIAPPPRLLPC